MLVHIYKIIKKIQACPTVYGNITGYILYRQEITNSLSSLGIDLVTYFCVRVSMSALIYSLKGPGEYFIALVVLGLFCFVFFFLTLGFFTSLW